MYVCDSVCVMSFSMCFLFDLHTYIVHTLDYKPKIYIHTYIHTCIHTHMHTYRQTDRQTGRQTNRQTDRQTDKQTYMAMGTMYACTSSAISIKQTCVALINVQSKCIQVFWHELQFTAAMGISQHNSWESHQSSCASRHENSGLQGQML